MEKKDCFAYREKKEKTGCKSILHIGCKILKRMDCRNCKFYRNDITEAEIERDIRRYTYKNK